MARVSPLGSQFVGDSCTLPVSVDSRILGQLWRPPKRSQATNPTDSSRIFQPPRDKRSMVEPLTLILSPLRAGRGELVLCLLNGWCFAARVFRSRRGASDEHIPKWI